MKKFRKSVDLTKLWSWVRGLLFWPTLYIQPLSSSSKGANSANEQYRTAWRRLICLFGQQRNRIRWKKTQNKSYYAVQGHSRSSRSVPIKSPYATSYQWLILTDNLSRTVSELSQLIAQILDICVFEPPFGGLGKCTMFILGSLESA